MVLHCFDCGEDIYIKGEDYGRVKYLTKDGKKRSKPICFACQGNHESALNDAYEMEKWHREHPGVDYEEYQIEQYYINRYGEY